MCGAGPVTPGLAHPSPKGSGLATGRGWRKGHGQGYVGRRWQSKEQGSSFSALQLLFLSTLHPLSCRVRFPLLMLQRAHESAISHC